MKLEGSDPAVDSLHALHDFIAHDSPAYARAFVQRLIHAAGSLAAMPRRGRIVPELRRDDIREIFFQTQRIVYRLEPDRVVVLAIVHVSRDLDRLPRPPWEIG